MGMQKRKEVMELRKLSLRHLLILVLPLLLSSCALFEAFTPTQTQYLPANTLADEFRITQQVVTDEFGTGTEFSLNSDSELNKGWISFSANIGQADFRSRDSPADGCVTSSDNDLGLAFVTCEYLDISTDFGIIVYGKANRLEFKFQREQDPGIIYEVAYSP